ncbi:hypothetical protein MTX78_16820 [Hymenobacter tibetensis]|uniref:Outer membrane protein beta-barrel domain-containing protein n=1 Tax=Hymenobacter tibetensis TaxID=497967 RepID=A0ABY4CU37_9BACT|nr:hypothetical protein [Hymenobacter tibetensis]UOG73776.1 hypothetical protein MTX78_16820 [Hymenobacter tibetensis]
MKYATLLACALLTAHISYGQKTEYSAHINSGGSAYRGPYAADGSVFTISDNGNVPFDTNSPYGRRIGFSYGLAAQIQRVTPTRDVFGVQAGYGVLQNRRNITEIQGYIFRAPSSGHITLTNRSVDAHPFFGRRFVVKVVDLDLTAGPELSLLYRIHVVENITTAGNLLYASEYDRDKPRLDLRARLNLAAYYKHIGLVVGYSRGLTNYYNNDTYGTRELYSHIVRAGVAYRI